MIKCIIFDLGGVYFTDGTSIALQKIKKILKINDLIVDELFRESPKKEGYLLRLGKLTSKEFWHIVAKKLKITDENTSKIKEIWHSSYKPNVGMKGLVQRLRKKYKVIVFSTNIKERVDYLERKYNLSKDFDNFIFSFEYGMTKKNPKFFKKLLEKINACPEECLFIDDKEKFLKIAKNLGMKIILFKNIDDLIKELKSLDIVI